MLWMIQCMHILPSLGFDGRIRGRWQPNRQGDTGKPPNNLHRIYKTHKSVMRWYIVEPEPGKQAASHVFEHGIEDHEKKDYRQGYHNQTIHAPYTELLALVKYLQKRCPWEILDWKNDHCYPFGSSRHSCRVLRVFLWI